MRRFLSLASILVLMLPNFLFLFVKPVAAAGKPIILIDPGHSGKDNPVPDTQTGLLDHDYPTDPEMKEVFDIAADMQTKLNAAGYSVVLTKKVYTDTVTLRARANEADKQNAVLAISIHDDHTVPWSTFAEVYTQKQGLYRTNSKGLDVRFDNQLVAENSQKYGAIIAAARTKAEGHTVKNTDVNFAGRNLDPGNIPMVMLFAHVPWVYNEVGASGTSFGTAEKAKYEQGMIDGIEQAIPLSTFAGGSGSTASACATTDVGKAVGTPIIPPDCATSGGQGGSVTGPCGAVIDWDQKIVDNLVVGGGGPQSGSGYDNLAVPQKSSCGASSPKSSWAGQYWCTYSIVDSYTLAGIKGLSISTLGGVVNMHQWWMKQPGFKYVEYQKASDKLGALNNVHPGYAMFMESSYLVHTGSEHVAEIKTISVDGHGNGKLTTLDSNSGQTEHTYTIVNGNIQPIIYPIAAFGGH